MTPLLEIAGLRVRYASAAGEALAGIDLTIGAGERVAVIGESGSGKSSLALAIAGLLPRDARVGGSLSWPGLSQPPRNGKDVGFVFQDPAGTLDSVVPVGRQVAEVVEVHLGLDRRSAMSRAAGLFGRVRLPDPDNLLHAYPHQLSGGQKQRVGIAAAIAAEPALLIADEPTSALDTIVQAGIVRLIDTLVRDTGMALLIVTHDIALAASIADRIVVLKDGAVVETGTATGIILEPQADYTRALLASCLPLDDPASPGEGRA
ncbi:ABC transporter ATP-binding protein [Kumtagia ephedrae]|uniref:Nickel import system ATP-binding protein NikD n=1 Tax=Kumtagia ephedrae TaxID=2116701 RepID=A0A2P7S1R1_9HYPH|nr:ABC transporter ATP-binding protein [Mesorhizobium ephedrae]PSJ56391.1 ABC transporter ATP-binding protein [Mesorhizobium ephedrae]